ncbi:8063_t:CDS:2 [Rhizophagus irregularis]|nr:8063_t:CDS:2 [Rhizophagus irregularis]
MSKKNVNYGHNQKRKRHCQKYKKTWSLCSIMSNSKGGDFNPGYLTQGSKNLIVPKSLDWLICFGGP